MPPHPAVRPATPTDHAEILRVVNLAYRVEEFFVRGDRITAELLAALARRSHGAFLVREGERPGTLAGSVYVESRGDHGWFGMLSVDPELQGRGHAGHLLGAVEEWCRGRGLARVELEVVDLRTELPAFYARVGYVPSGERPFPDPEKLLRPARMLVMTKRLG